MDLLLDTHVLVRLAEDSAVIRPAVQDAIVDRRNRCFVSAVTGFEFEDLNRRGRFSSFIELVPLVQRLRGMFLDYPAKAWRLVETLPDLHRDPVDRMLIAHALHDDLVLVTADETMRRYPVRTLW